MSSYKCPKCGSSRTGRVLLSWETYQCESCEKTWKDSERRFEELTRIAPRPLDVWTSPGNYGSTIASVGIPTLGSTPIGKLSGIPGDDIVRDHRGSSVGRVKDIGNYKVLEWGWWLP